MDRSYHLSESASSLFTSCTGLQVDLLGFLIETQKLSPTKDEILEYFENPSRADIKSLNIQLNFKPLKEDARSACQMTGSLLSKHSPLSKLLADLRAEGNSPVRFVEAEIDRFAADQSALYELQHPFPLLQIQKTKTRLLTLVETAARNRGIMNVQTFGQLATLLLRPLSLRAEPTTRSMDFLHVQTPGHLATYLNRPLHSEPKAFRARSVTGSSRLLNAIQWTILAYCSRYSTPISLEGSFLRQSKYIELMGRQLWIRSPTLTSTLGQAQARYQNFITLFARYPQTTLAPTPDIDLVWHTHQCSPVRYRLFAKLATGGTEIDHNDGLGQGTIDDARKRTGRLYRAEFSEEYERCLCWDCEAVREASTTTSKGGLKAGDEAALEEAVTKMVQKVTFYRSVERARRTGKLN